VLKHSVGGLPEADLVLEHRRQSAPGDASHSKKELFSTEQSGFKTVAEFPKIQIEPHRTEFLQIQLPGKSGGFVRRFTQMNTDDGRHITWDGYTPIGRGRMSNDFGGRVSVPPAIAFALCARRREV
jgi:hypothetical protein